MPTSVDYPLDDTPDLLPSLTGRCLCGALDGEECEEECPTRGNARMRANVKMLAARIAEAIEREGGVEKL